MTNKRYNFLDAIRIIAFAMIIFYHMVIQLALDGFCSLDAISPFYSNANIQFANIGVTLFFMISGAGLMLSSRENFNLKDYYKKRFLKILVPFYLVYIVYLIYLKISCDFNAVFVPGIPLWRIIFTVLGMDEYIYASTGLLTFSIGIGEWFLGCIILMYLLFPLVRKCMLKNKHLTLLLATIIYIFTVVTYNSDIPSTINFILKFYEFILGMYLILTIEKLPKWSQGILLPIIILYICWPTTFPIFLSFSIAILGVTLFLFFRNLEDIFTRTPKLIHVIKTCCSYSFEVYLIHHVIIRKFSAILSPRIVTIWGVLFLFFLEIVAMLIGSIIVKKMVTLIIGFNYKKLFIRK